MSVEKWIQAEQHMRVVRSEMFGGEEPPFSDIDGASAWLKQQSEIGQDGAFAAAIERLRACFNSAKAIMLAEYMGFPPGFRMNIGIERDLIAVPGHSEGQDYIPATTAQLARLAQESRYIETYLGCRKVDAVAALLVGSRPPRLLGRYHYAPVSINPIGRTAPRRTLELGPDTKLNWETFRDMTESFPESRRLGLSPKDESFLALIDELWREGLTPPEKGCPGVESGVMRYWTYFITRWNTSDDPIRNIRPYKRWHAAKDHYRQILQRSGTGA